MTKKSLMMKRWRRGGQEEEEWRVTLLLIRRFSTCMPLYCMYTCSLCDKWGVFVYGGENGRGRGGRRERGGGRGLGRMTARKPSRALT